MKSKCISFCMAMLLLVSCATSSKFHYSESELQAFETFIDSGDFQIVSDWAIPLANTSLNALSNAGLLPVSSTPGRINLIGNVNYLKIQGDSTQAYLPYFGERQIGGAYGDSNRGIAFEAVPEDLEIHFDKEKNRANIQFTASRDTETFDVMAVIFPNRNSIITINSNQRRTISYRGMAQSIHD
ncbi:MAG: DUF4251 domain-containing protein [Allomuricauda sp.]|nr:MAG: DUF4251 domain-containing protein [Allomuricauda sp.]